MNKDQLRFFLNDNNWLLKRQLGQYFFVNVELLKLLVDSFPMATAVVEIGAGVGTLTKLLAEKYPTVISYEIDLRFKEYLCNSYTNVTFIFEDFLKADLPNMPYLVVANIPYYVSTQIVIKLLKDSNFQEGYLLVEKLWIERILKDKNPSMPTYILRNICNFSIVKSVATSDFYPPCPVESVFVKITRRDIYPEDVEVTMKSLFSARRKVLPESLQKRSGKNRLAELNYHQLISLLKEDL